MKFYDRDVLEAAAQASAIAYMRKSDEIFRNIAYNYRVPHEIYSQTALASQALLAKNYSSVAQTTEILQQTNIQISAAQVAAQLVNQSRQALPSFAAISSMVSSSAVVNVAKSLELLSEKDFRISVASQEINHELESNPEGVIDNLLFKEPPEPSNEFETQFFDILEQQREILNDYADLFNKINDSQGENVSDKRFGKRDIRDPKESSKKPQNDEKHETPAFYLNKMWYVEEIASNLLWVVVVAIYEMTISSDSTASLAFVLLLGCLLRFIKTK